MNKQQLANKIRTSANNMHNKIDANEYKHYILGLIFYKFLSDTEVKYFTHDCEWEDDELVDLVENYEGPNRKNLLSLQRTNGVIGVIAFLMHRLGHITRLLSSPALPCADRALSPSMPH